MKNLKENARLLLIVPSILMTFVSGASAELHGEVYNGDCNVDMGGGHMAAESCGNDNVTCSEDGTCSATVNGVKHNGKATGKKVKHELKKKLKSTNKSTKKDAEMFKFTQLRP